MPNIHFIGGEKGGVGKSVVSRLMAQYYIDRRKPFSVFDADLSHGAMVRCYADYTEAVDPTKFESLDQIAEVAIEKGHDVIVDLAAQTMRSLNQWLTESGVKEMGKELGITPVFWHVMDDGLDSQRLLGETLKLHGKGSKYVVVRNHGRGADFEPFNQSPEKKLADKRGAKFLDLPALTPATMSKIDRKSASFWAAANSKNSDGEHLLGVMDRQRVKIWIVKAYGQLEQVLNLRPQPKPKKEATSPEQPIHPGYY